MPADSLHGQLQASLGTAYTIERELGGGGMSRVFVATDTAFARQVVVKVLPPEMAATVSIERFKREIMLAARLQHPHIVPVLAAGETDGLPWFIMPYVNGESLRMRLAHHGELPVSEGVRVLREIASALGYAHERGIVHRDVKPDNVLLSGGSAMVTDFGVAKALSASSNAEHGGMTSLGVALGTPAYMSPEQASADPTVDHRADVYAFGVLAYELLTGQTPFAGRTPQGLLAAHVTEPPEPIQKRRPSLPPGLATLVMRCLEKRPADRPQTASEIVHALDDLTTPSGGMSPAAPQVDARDRPALTSQGDGRRRIMRITGSMAVFALLVTAAFLVSRRGNVNVATTAPSAPAVRSIAVLPLENVSADTAMQFFADGMSDELATTITKIPGLSVASRTATASAFAAAKGDMKSLGQRLNVGAVLEGRIRRSGNRMRLTAQLVNVSDDHVIWSDAYDREVKEVFQLQDDVARAIAGALRVALGGSGGALAERGTTSSEAHDLYLRGRYLQARYTEPDLRQSLELFRQALAKDSTYARAWSGIADSWSNLADDFVPARDVLPQQREAIARGMALDSTVSELHMSRGILAFWYDRDYVTAQQELERALRLDPSVPGIESVYGVLLWSMGRRDSAASFARERVARDATNPAVLDMVMTLSLGMGDTASALGYCRREVELHLLVAYCQALDSLTHGSLGPMERYSRRNREPLTGDRPVLRARVGLVHMLGLWHRDAEARSIADSLAQLARGGAYVNEIHLVKAYASIGDVPRTLEWLERAHRSNNSVLGGLYFELADTRVSGDPRIVAFAKRIGLPNPPPYWR